MTLTSYFLVTFESESAASQRAGLKYFIITHGATLCMVAAALLLWRTSGSFHFDAIRQTLAELLNTRPFLAHLIIFLFFLGFATKAGILPMGDWLPDAHPVAPSGMSATLSGALVKLGIYGLVRLFCSFLVASPSLRIWGIILALAGTGSLFAGNLTALRQTDTKRLMAFSTIGQIGYICLGLGAGVILSPDVPGGSLNCSGGCDFPCCKPRVLQVVLVPRSRVGALPDRQARHGQAGRLGWFHAVHNRHDGNRLIEHRGSATLQRVR